MRQDSQLEALKQRIAESARKAGLDEEFGVEKNIRVRLRSFSCFLFSPPAGSHTDNVNNFVFVFCRM